MNRGITLLTVMAGLMVTALFINIGVLGLWPPVTVGMVPTGSMAPYIEPGDIIFVDRTVPFQDARVGDVVVYWGAGNMVAHRVIELTDTELVTQGDANSFKDKPVVEEQYVGVVDGLYEVYILNWLLVRLPLDSLLVFPNNILLILNMAAFGFLVFVLDRVFKKRGLRRTLGN